MCDVGVVVEVCEECATAQSCAGVISPYNHIWHIDKVCKFAGGSVLKVLIK